MLWAFLDGLRDVVVGLGWDLRPQPAVAVTERLLRKARWPSNGTRVKPRGSAEPQAVRGSAEPQAVQPPSDDEQQSKLVLNVSSSQKCAWYQ